MRKVVGKIQGCPLSQGRGHEIFAQEALERRGDEATIMMEEMMFGWDASRYSKIDLSDED